MSLGDASGEFAGSSGTHYLNVTQSESEGEASGFAARQAIFNSNIVGIKIATAAFGGLAMTQKVIATQPEWQFGGHTRS